MENQVIAAAKDWIAEYDKTPEHNSYFNIIMKDEAYTIIKGLLGIPMDSLSDLEGCDAHGTQIDEPCDCSPVK